MVFEAGMAEIYDLIYRDKDYEGETDFIESIFRNFASKPVKSILEGGCGTGGHALPLAKRGYDVTGIDTSADMVRYARDKAKKARLDISYRTADLRRFELNRKFDSCLLMFSVVGYLTRTDELLQTLARVKNHLKKGSLFVFDFWNGLAVLRSLPSERVKEVADKGRKIVRTAKPELDSFNHLCHVHYRILVFQNEVLSKEINETHTVRYFFPQELIHYLEESGFKVFKICPFLDLNGKADESVWNLTAIARA